MVTGFVNIYFLKRKNGLVIAGRHLECLVLAVLEVAHLRIKPFDRFTLKEQNQ